MAKDERITMWIGSTLKADAQRLAQQRDQSLAALIRYLLRREVEKEK